ncbi:hypothetical protein [Actinomadura rupiterrae]|uniref:hypothetical protein n=1 Tax=Actinomadura rupiterrae TaxID=559627 RepID=UPI002646A358|nr:hypothetical protein [Actinomadura rupiterrae]MCP2338907.1 hypothetical protein [Actinomadura rupiterrae]
MATSSTTSSSLTRGLDGRGSDTAVKARSRRNGSLVLLGLLLVVGCGLAFAVVVADAGHRRPVVMVVRALPAGAVLRAGDVVVVQANVPAGVRVVPGSQLAAVVGRPVAVPLVARSLLSPEAVAGSVFPPVGQSVLGVALKAGRFPPDLVAGARVRAFRVPAGDQPGAKPADTAALPVTTGTVVRVEPQRDGDGAVVELQVPADDIPQVAAVAATGAVSLVLVAGG